MGMKCLVYRGSHVKSVLPKVSLLTLLVMAPQAGAKEVTRKELDPNAVHHIGVAHGQHTLLTTPIPCTGYAFGDTTHFRLDADPGEKAWQEFFLSARKDIPGTSTSLTLRCDDGVSIVIEVVQVDPTKADAAVKFVFDAEESERVRQARLEAIAECETSSDAAAEKKLMERLAMRAAVLDDHEMARQDYVIVRVRQIFVFADKVYIVFEVQNRTGDPVVIANATLLDEGTRQQVTGTNFVMPSKRVSAGSRDAGVVSLPATDHSRTVSLTVKEAGTRTITVTDIDL